MLRINLAPGYLVVLISGPPYIANYMHLETLGLSDGLSASVSLSLGLDSAILAIFQGPVPQIAPGSSRLTAYTTATDCVASYHAPLLRRPRHGATW
jgi:hypothetical protein